MRSLTLHYSHLLFIFLIFSHYNLVLGSFWDDLSNLTFKWTKFGGFLLEDVRSRVYNFIFDIDGASIIQSFKSKINFYAKNNPDIACIGNLKLCCYATFKGDVNGLERSLKKHLHGQHLVNEIVVKAIRGHLKMEPKKALTLSFHGWTGGGKNFVSKMIAEHLFKDGMESRFVHLFISTLHFPHRHKIEIYQDNLVQWIRGNITQCGTSLFIFDELDKMPPGLLDSVKSFLDYHAYIDGHSFNKAIFIFISNTVGIELTKVAIKFWKEEKDRNDISLKDVSKLLNAGAFNELSGLQYSSIVQNNLIDFYVPFLPLERAHVEMCARDEIKQRGGIVTEELLNDVADSLLYYPPSSLLYSTSGCKQVAKKLDLFMDDDDDEL